MARRNVVDESSDDEFPKLQALGLRNGTSSQTIVLYPRTSQQALEGKSAKPSLRRRKLVQISDNALIRPWGEHEKSAKEDAATIRGSKQPNTRLRERSQQPVVTELGLGDHASTNDCSTHSFSEDDASEFHTALESGPDEDESFAQIPSIRLTERLQLSGSGEIDNLNKPDKPEQEMRTRRSHSVSSRSRAQARETLTAPREAQKDRKEQRVGDSITSPRPRSTIQSNRQKRPESGLTQALEKLQIEDIKFPGDEQPFSISRPITPTATPPRAHSGRLVSPRKLERIPITPHRPSMDTFWDQEFVDEWNDEHSPKKTLWPTEINKSLSKKSPSKKIGHEKAARKAFEKAKHGLANSFLGELDETITGGQLQRLAESTGGIKLTWTNKLNTTAGRANWKRETIKTKTVTGEEVTARHRHHASIELAEKVIDDEHRLLNVLAHEFCHLANFMISGITTNPHGKEFKAWASKCSRSFGHRGVDVTTKHTYDIDFKYIWECTACSMEFKRHSKSINPERHRCGSCKGELRQAKPIPRASGKTSEYQNFMREQMKIVKEQNPGSPQKEILKIAAGKFRSRKDITVDENSQHEATIDNVADALDQLKMDDKL